MDELEKMQASILGPRDCRQTPVPKPFSKVTAFNEIERQEAEQMLVAHAAPYYLYLLFCARSTWVMIVELRPYHEANALSKS